MRRAAVRTSSADLADPVRCPGRGARLCRRCPLGPGAQVVIQEDQQRDDERGDQAADHGLLDPPPRPAHRTARAIGGALRRRARRWRRRPRASRPGRTARCPAYARTTRRPACCCVLEGRRGAAALQDDRGDRHHPAREDEDPRDDAQQDAARAADEHDQPADQHGPQAGQAGLQRGAERGQRAARRRPARPARAAWSRSASGRTRRSGSPTSPAHRRSARRCPAGRVTGPAQRRPSAAPPVPRPKRSGRRSVRPEVVRVEPRRALDQPSGGAGREPSRPGSSAAGVWRSEGTPALGGSRARSSCRIWRRPGRPLVAQTAGPGRGAASRSTVAVRRGGRCRAALRTAIRCQFRMNGAS